MTEHEKLAKVLRKTVDMFGLAVTLEALSTIAADKGEVAKERHDLPAARLWKNTAKELLSSSFHVRDLGIDGEEVRQAVDEEMAAENHEAGRRSAEELDYFKGRE
jgi:hypothetical protein